MGKILVVGSINMDMTIFTNRIPSAGETITGTGFLLSPGGKGANQAVAAARMDAETTMYGCVGDDVFGHELMHSLGTNGVNIRSVRALNGVSTGVASITVCGGDNRIILHAGANARVGLEPLLESLIEESDALVVQLEIPLETVFAAIDIAHGLNKRVFLTPAPAVALPEKLYAKIDYLLPNEGESSALLGRDIISDQDVFWALNQFRVLGVAEPVITLGERGVGLFLDGKPRILPAYRVQSVDTTAAGDTFTGALASAIVDGMALIEAVDFAERAAAICVTRPGAQNAIPTREEVLRASFEPIIAAW
jgi:ribokinase